MPQIMFQGTGSGVGKSWITAGFCRLLYHRGYRVAPFKAQNMALNSGVTAYGEEMGRSQILQAEACCIQPDVRMNPVLIKPEAPGRSQLIRNGHRVESVSHAGNLERAQENFRCAQQAFDSLSKDYDWIVLEGAGSPAEINLHATDIVNMRMAAHARSPVFVIGDIHQGGVFAWLKGTYDLVEDFHRPLIKGFLINKFLGERSLLQPGIDRFQSIVSAPILGVLPYLKLQLDEEDAQGLSNMLKPNQPPSIAIIQVPYISNFTDFKTLEQVAKGYVTFTQSLSEVAQADLIILPGSKSTLADLAFLKSSGLFDVIQQKAGKAWILGICGGFQMLGNQIQDTSYLESEHSLATGLSLLPLHTHMAPQKVLQHRSYKGAGPLQGYDIKGYEIHLGESDMQEQQGLTQLCEDKDLFVMNSKKKVLGSYIHGLLDTPEVIKKLFNIMELKLEIDWNGYVSQDQQLDLLAESIERHCDVEQILEISKKEVAQK